MAGAMRKVGEYLGLVEQAEYDEFDSEYEDEDESPAQVPARQQTAAVRPSPAPVAHIEDRRSERRERRPQSQPQSAPRPVTAEDLARIETVTPRTYNDARTVGEHFRAGVPVIMNLSEIDDDDAKRLVDFAAGLIFAVHGTINRVTSKVFLLSPANVTVTDEDKQRLASGGFYNHS